jgi:hypothetical protein
MGCLIAAANFVWFIIVCRSWTMPDGRTSLQMYRDEQAASREAATPEPKER